MRQRMTKPPTYAIRCDHDVCGCISYIVAMPSDSRFTFTETTSLFREERPLTEPPKDQAVS
ncbi:hypothetical protein [Tautonia plasticadhaerens]|uniref:Uncharacterized protein n=1 Tax=Tautonia plasticadhaerens TaxID=2527974 RepID=A0A518H2B4_9BACT|nr:hypothetical protein [Tautonia plasticadhaerens]QDV34991.1 hypothetical protein ElP_28880 [Tautonia plasticadhaerens]